MDVALYQRRSTGPLANVGSTSREVAHECRAWKAHIASPTPGEIVSLSTFKQMLSDAAVLKVGAFAKSEASKRDINEQTTAEGKCKHLVRVSP